MQHFPAGDVLLDAPKPFPMFRNYLKIAVRQLGKQKFYSFIKIGGFALGIATCLLITLYIRHELSFDRDYANGDRLYRVVQVYLAGQWDGGARARGWRRRLRRPC